MFFVVDPVFDKLSRQLHQDLDSLFVRYPHLKSGSMDRLKWMFTETQKDAGRALLGFASACNDAAKSLIGFADALEGWRSSHD